MGAYHYREHASFQAFIDQAANGASEASRRTSRESGDRGGWFGDGIDSYDKAVTLAREGWPEGTARARVLTEATVDKLATVLRRDEWVYDVEAGRGDVDMARFIIGDPECVLAPVTVEELAPKRAVHIVVSGSASCGVSTEAIILRGAAVAALAELLTLAGYRVKLSLSHVCSASGDKHETRVTVKDFGEHLDLARMVYAVAHPSTLRRHMFSIEEQEPEHIRSRFGFNGGGYGIPDDCPPDARGDIYLGSMLYTSASDWTPEKTAAWVLANLRAQGVKVDAGDDMPASTPSPTPSPSPSPSPTPRFRRRRRRRF